MECDQITITLFSMIAYIQRYRISKRILDTKWIAFFKIELQYGHQYCKYLQ